VHIYNCTIKNGDDNVAVKENCSNIVVEDCAFATGHGASIGSIHYGNVNNVTCTPLMNDEVQHINIQFIVAVRRITFDSNVNGARIKTVKGGKGKISDITFDDFRMNNVKNSIVVTGWYTDSTEEHIIDYKHSTSQLSLLPALGGDWHVTQKMLTHYRCTN
jgi:polygalacturonase